MNGSVRGTRRGQAESTGQRSVKVTSLWCETLADGGDDWMETGMTRGQGILVVVRLGDQECF